MNREFRFTELRDNRDESSFHSTNEGNCGMNEPHTPTFSSIHQSGGSSRGGQKRKSSLLAVMENGYKATAASIKDRSINLQCWL